MMKKLNGILSVVCALILIPAIFTGCAKVKDVQDSQAAPGTTAKDTASAQDTTTTPPAQEPVTLRFSWWGGDARHKATLEAIDLYTRKNPHVTIEAEYGGYGEYYQKLVTQLAGGGAPDIMQVDNIWIADLYKQGEMFVDLYTLADKIDISGIDKTFLKNFCEVEGKLQGIPKSITSVMFIYNKEYFKKFNIDENTKLDWDNMLEIGTRVHRKDPESYLIEPHFGMMKSLILSYMKQKSGSNLITDDYKLGHDKAVILEALTYLRKLVDNGAVVPYEDAATITEADERPTWQNGKSGIIYNFDGTIGKIKGNSTFDLGVMIPPVMSGAKDTAVTVKPGVLTSINAQTKHLDECAKFMDFYSNDKDALLVLGDTRGVPPTSDAAKILVDGGKIDPLLSVASELGKANAGSPVNANSNNTEIDKIVEDIMNEVGFKSKSPEKAADDMVSKIEEKLTEIKNSME
jgi:oligogalacturonide transport system substrate-binding protein